MFRLCVTRMSSNCERQTMVGVTMDPFLSMARDGRSQRWPVEAVRVFSRLQRVPYQCNACRT